MPQRVLAQRRPHPVVAGGGRVALVEHQVDHLEHRRQPGRELVAAGDLERHTGLGQRPLGAHHPLLHRRLGHEERAGDLLRGQAAEQPQRERHPGVRREHRVAGHEHQAEQVVADVVHGCAARSGASARGRQLPADLLALALERRVASHRVDRPELRGGHQPGARVVGDAGPRPPLERRDQRVLGEVLRQPDVADDPGQAGDQPGGLDPPDGLDRPVGRRLRHAIRAPRSASRSRCSCSRSSGVSCIAEVLGLEDPADLDLGLTLHRVGAALDPLDAPRPCP